jgi:hypothetical protein
VVRVLTPGSKLGLVDARELLLHPVRTFTSADLQLPRTRAESRMSAFVYGDVLVLAATAGVSYSDISSGKALLIVLGTVVSTYLAHVLADVVGAVFAGHGSADLLRTEVRDSVPVVTAGVPALILLTAAAIDVLPALWAQGAACAILIARLAGIGLVYRRLHDQVTTGTALRFGAVVAVVAAVAVILKLVLTH